jgi:pyrroline-5-carboxylate reductase
LARLGRAGEIVTKIAIIGGGNMGEALLAGLLAEGTATPAGLWATDVDSDRLSTLQKRYGIQTGRDNREAASWADVLVLAVKPQMMSRVLEDLKDHLPEATLVISVATGISLARIAGALGGNRKLVRVMTNTPVLVRAGASALAISPLVSPQDRALAIRLFEAVGKVILVEEHLMDAVTGLSGSGPAYIFQVIEALADGGVKMGLPRETALSLAAQTVFGAAKLQLETNEHPGRLKDKVASPGGTTIAGLHALEAGGVRAAFMAAVEAATKRAEELGRQ